jgi:hypothetical protein
VYTATRSDADSGDTVTWTLSGPDAALFTIDPATGVVTLNAAQDFASPGDANGDGIYQITVRATDGAGQFDQRNVQLTLTEVPAAPASSIAQPQLPGSGTASSTTGPSAPSAPSTAPALPPFAPSLADRPLGLPVDAVVAPANFAGAPGAVAPIDSVATAGIDLNALPPTAAGMPTTFGLMRVSLEVAAAFDILPPETGGHRLFVYHGVPDMRLLVQDSGFLRVPINAFAHTDPSAVVTLEARLADGSPLPGWLRFDGLRGMFSGTPPEGADETLEVEVVARDTDGREARTRFTLEIEAIRNPAAAAALALGLDVDKEEAEKARLEAVRQAAEAKAAGKAGTATAGVRPANPGAATFSDQVSAAKAQRDPLLERIAPADKAKPGGARR